MKSELGTKFTEHEVKILEININRIREILISKGSQKILDDLTHIEVYDIGEMNSDKLDYKQSKIYRENIQLAEIFINKLQIASKATANLVNVSAYLRLRREGDKQEIIFKQKTDGNKLIKNETEISLPVNDWKDAQNFLGSLGMKMVGIQEKHRESYILDNLRFDLDTWPGIPSYLEIEGNSVESIQSGVKLLGYEMSETTSMGGKELFDSYRVNYIRMIFT